LATAPATEKAKAVLDDLANYKAVIAGNKGDLARAVKYAKRTKNRVPK
jgi:hypothetical protein